MLEFKSAVFFVKLLPSLKILNKCMRSDFIFPTFKQMYPNEKRPLKLLREYLRYIWRKFYFNKEYAALISWLNTDCIWLPLFIA